MAAEVSSLLRVMDGGYKEDIDNKHRMVGNESNSVSSTALITRDLLGGSNSIETQDLNLDLQVPLGWEKRLDLKSGKMSIQRCNSSSSSPSMSENKLNMNEAGPKLDDLNFPPSSSKVPLNLFDETTLDLKLFSSSLPSSNFQSVCTLDKVKSALERAKKEPIRKKRSLMKSTLFSSPSASYSSSSFSIRETLEEESDEKVLSSPMAVGCPGCLSYVLITKNNNPECPKCNSVVTLPLMKKPRIDLNITI
ncbi:hypothetical protein TanjilG_29787 [Lupinus angustifolius]|uniref:GIR1-like zinc ribbon domain-containing protein n=1 Tax=Lupinus angustifolius TaxID=3871 RepID=A0A394DMT3_LUPAN|nr:PREDICTED: uncharacterized protein LOC109339384 [Lupinus angustifolius]OIW21131.1 hypothetical protein TanjilG_29787 [Lupinus angustifolius]